MNLPLDFRRRNQHLANRPLDWYCTTCDEEMDITKRENHMSAPPHDGNPRGIGLGYRNEEGTETHAEGDGVSLEGGQWKGELGPNPPTSWTCAICDIAVNIFNRDNHLRDKSHVKKVWKQTRDQLSSAPQSKQPSSSTWNCPVCEESMHVFYQAEHVAGKQHFRRVRERKLGEDPALAHVQEMYSLMGFPDDDEVVHNGAAVHDKSSEMDSADDQQITNDGALLPSGTELGNVASPSVVPTNTFSHHVTEGQYLPNGTPQLLGRHSECDETEHPPLLSSENNSRSFTNTRLDDSTPTPVQVVPPARELFCDVCERGFQKQEKFNLHFSTKKHRANASAERFYCEVCEKYFEASVYKRHRSPAWKCVACDVSMHVMRRNDHLPKAGHKKNQLLLEERVRMESTGAISG